MLLPFDVLKMSIDKLIEDCGKEQSIAEFTQLYQEKADRADQELQVRQAQRRQQGKKA
jgi:hypothetical protein